MQHEKSEHITRMLIVKFRLLEEALGSDDIASKHTLDSLYQHIEKLEGWG
jgi:hypothetical protein